MKTIKKVPIMMNTIIYTMALALAFGGCSKESTPIAGPDASSSQSISLAKEATATAIVAVDTITSALGGKLKIHGQNINDGEFDVQPGNVDGDRIMHLVKLSETSNSYHFEPFGLDMPAGVRITLEYSNSAMPFGVLESDLKVFQLVGDSYVALDSRVQANKMEVRADAFSTGEFALGAYDVDGHLQIIEGEFGLRKEESINPKKGGTIKLGGGSELVIPKDALSEKTLIGVIATRETIMGKSDSKAFTFTPHGTVFNKPVTLVLSWKEYAGEPVELYYFNEFTEAWELTAAGVWDESNRTVTLELNHFSRYAVAWSN